MSPSAPHVPDSSEAAYIRGKQRLKLGDYEGAESDLKEAVRLNHGDAAIYYALGNCLRHQSKSAEAETALRESIRLAPGMEEATVSLAYLLNEQGRADEAGSLLMKLAESHRDNPPLLHRVGTLLAELRCYQAAASLYIRIVELEPSARSYLRLGEFHQKLGHYHEAAQALSKAIELDPDMDAAYLLLAHTQRITEKERSLVVRYERVLLEAQSLKTTTRACLHFGAGKMYDDLRDYNQAFSHIDAGNKLLHGEHPFQKSAWKDYFLRLQATASILPQPQQMSEETGIIPVFIVGMMRSGTTLVERILASHPRVVSLGESDLIEALASRASTLVQVPYPECLGKLNATDFAQLAAAHQQRWPQHVGRYQQVVDKNPLNFLHLGLISQVFPHARIIHCTRHPLDTCLSIYFQNFAHPRNNYSFDLSDIAFFYRAYHDLMSRWRNALPQGMFYELHYEELIGDTESKLRLLLEYLGLPWDDACLQFHQQSDSIATASVWQARQPLYKDSIGRWRHYQTWLQPLIRELGPEIAQTHR